MSYTIGNVAHIDEAMRNNGEQVNNAVAALNAKQVTVRRHKGYWAKQVTVRRHKGYWAKQVTVRSHTTVRDTGPIYLTLYKA